MVLLLQVVRVRNTNIGLNLFLLHTFYIPQTRKAGVLCENVSVFSRIREDFIWLFLLIKECQQIFNHKKKFKKRSKFLTNKSWEQFFLFRSFHVSFLNMIFRINVPMFLILVVEPVFLGKALIKQTSTMTSYKFNITENLFLLQNAFCTL